MDGIQELVNPAMDENNVAFDYLAYKELERQAMWSANCGEPYDAALAFERLGYKCLESALARFDAPKHFLRAALSYLACACIHSAKVKISQYPKMENTTEKQFVEELITACENHDMHIFCDALTKYEQIRLLEAMELRMLVRVKRFIQQEYV